ncbi:FecR domain-containing protein, partial [Prosthecobacter sp.]|uniref:FecR domain-containing protein n=1 Tax=Prosthecobacter sp. TaxID=1965333 RepID=UPI0024886D70
MKENERNLLMDDLIDGEISEADFLRLEAEMTVDPAARRAYYDRIALSMLLKTEANVQTRQPAPMKKQTRYWTRSLVMMAAAVVALLLAVGVLLQQETAPSEETKASGFAVLAGQAAAVWAQSTSLADGALLPAGPLHLVSGVAQIELFSGVTVIVEGAADFEIVSAMEMNVKQGKVRARVPEPAHGFRMHTSAGEVVDLGTEFAMNVSGELSEVHVLDGEVEWHPRTEAMQRMEKGEALRWDVKGQGAAIKADATEFVGLAEMSERVAAARKSRQAEWRHFMDTLLHDPRLVAYYQMRAADGRRLSNEAVAGAAQAGEGAIVAAARVSDRWGAPGSALDFSPAGSRVRLNVPGEYHALTLMTWVKINSLDRRYNSLFLTDGHDLGEPHWQIMNDGR